MSDRFDQYYTWLGIPPEEQPPDFYRLLGIRRFESNPEVISNALGQRQVHLRSYESGERAAAAQQVLRELAQAGECLANAEKKGAYDRELRQKDAPKLGRMPAAPQFSKPASLHKSSPNVPVDGTKPAAEPVVFNETPASPPPAAVPWQTLAIMAAGGVGIFVLGGIALAAALYGAGLFSNKPAKGPPIAQNPPDIRPYVPGPLTNPGQGTFPNGTPIGPPEIKPPTGGIPVGPKPSIGTFAGTPPEPVIKTPDQTPTPEPPPVVPPEPVAKTPEPTPTVDPTPAAEPAPKETRLALPDSAALDKSLEEIKETYKEEYLKVKPSDRASLAGLQLKAAESEINPAMLYSLLREARRLKLSLADMEGAFLVADQMSSRFARDPWEVQAETLEESPEWPESVSRRKTLTDNARRVAEGALAATQFTSARKAAVIAEKLGDAKLKKEASDWIESAERGSKQETAYAAALKKLQVVPNDAEANEVCGKFLCFVKRDWEQGLPYLGRARAPSLQEVARQDLAGPTGADGQIALADKWWQVAESLSAGREQDSLKLRARRWYELALPTAGGIRQAQIAKRIGETAKLAGEAAAAREPTVKVLPDILPDPGSLGEYRGQVNKMLLFAVVGSASGSVYGSNPYTDDSTLATAAVHAGALPPGKPGVVKVTILRGMRSYRGTMQHGVTSSEWDEFEGSYKVEATKHAFPSPTDTKETTGPKRRPGAPDRESGPGVTKKPRGDR